MPPIPQEDVAALYATASDQLRAMGGNEASLADNMRRQRINQRRHAFVKELERREGVRVFLEPPRLDIQVTPEDASRGPANASVTVVEFSDFQCPFCSRMATLLRQLETRYAGRVRRVFRDYPLSMHKDATRAAEAADCAGEQGRFWEMHDRLFEGQQDLSSGAIGRYALDIGLNVPTFSACLNAGGHASDWRRGRVDGDRYSAANRARRFAARIRVVAINAGTTA